MSSEAIGKPSRVSGGTCAYRKQLLSWRDGDWRDGPQLFGELVAASVLLAEFTDWANHELESAMTNGDHDSRNIRVLVGVAFAIGNLLKDKLADENTARLFEELIGIGNDDVLTAMASTFNRSDVLFVHPNAERVLRSMLRSDAFLAKAAGSWIIEELEKFVAVYPELVGALCHRFVDVNESGHSDEKYFRSGPHLTNIAYTLQRLGSQYRELGLSLFEKLLELGLTDANDLLKEIDNRPVVGACQPRPLRRRRSNT